METNAKVSGGHLTISNNNNQLMTRREVTVTTCNIISKLYLDAELSRIIIGH